jgi:hypothetical protein
VAALEVVSVVAAVVLIVAGAWGVARALVLDRSRGRLRCPGCWYEIGPGSLLRCPECGREAASEGALLRTRRRWGWGAIACAAVVAGLVSLRAVEAWERGSWWALAPSWAMRGVMAVDDWTGLGRGPGDPAVRTGPNSVRVTVRPVAQKQGTYERYRSAWRNGRALLRVRGDDASAEHLLALQRMRTLGYEARVALPMLERVARDPEGPALAVIGLIGDLTEVDGTDRILAGLARSEDMHVRLAAVRGLAVRGVRPRLVIPILSELVREDPTRMTVYVHLMGRYGGVAAPEMVSMLGMERSDVKAMLLFLLLRMGPLEAGQDARVVEELSRVDGLVLKNVLWRLGWDGGHSGHVARGLREVWARSRPESRLIMAGWVVNQRVAWAEGRWFVVMGLRDEDAGVRRAVAEMLESGRIDVGRAVRDELERMASEEVDPGVREAARRVLAR